MIAHTSPFQHWINKEMVGIAASNEIMELLAKAFDGGKRYENEACAEEAEGAASDDNKYDIAAAIRARIPLFEGSKVTHRVLSFD